MDVTVTASPGLAAGKVRVRPAARPSVTSIAIDHLKAMILEGQLHPGDRLPPEADLAESLGLSRTSLREAVRVLSFLRVLETRQGDGTYVSSLQPAIMLQALGFIIDLQRNDSLLDMVAVRRILEPAATAEAALRSTPELVRRLRESADRSGQCSDVPGLVAEDLRFHQMIAQATGNPVLCALLDGLSAPTVRFRVWRGLIDDDNVRRTIVEHRSIVDAVAAGDAERAHAAAVLHIAGVQDWLSSYLTARPVEPNRVT